MTLTLYSPEGIVENTGRSTAATIGVFDGVHIGHRHLLKQLAAASGGLASVAVALTSHPAYVLGSRTDDRWLDEPGEHRDLLFEAGADYVAELPFTREVAAMSACQMAEALHRQLHMKKLLLGYDSRFGSRKADDFGRLPALAARLGFDLMQGQPYGLDGQPASSSRIREALWQGNVGEARTLLGRPYSLCGTVEHGRGVGRTLGFPTANINLAHSRKMQPAEGVYAVRLTTSDGAASATKGMANLGAAPTFGIEQPQLEVHLMDFCADLYGRQATVEFIGRVRPTRRFTDAEALKKQISKDYITCREIFSNTSW